MDVIKSSGERQAFDPEKIRRSIKRTGATDAVVDALLVRLQPELYDGMTTKELYARVREQLKKESVCYACRYNLRDAIRALGPAGFNFEKYVASILNAYQFRAEVPVRELQGACVSHEVDVVAEKDGRRMFIEAKFRRDFDDVVNLKDTMATWARFLDLVDGSAIGLCPRFDEPWIVTNARFSDRSRQFGSCKGMHLVGWNFPTDSSFSYMVDHLTLYPVTVLELAEKELAAFADTGIMLCKEVADMDPEELAERVGLSRDRATEIHHLSETVVAGEAGHEHKTKRS